MAYAIRPAHPMDEAALAALYLQVRQHSMGWLPVQEFALNDFVRHSAGEDVFVAEADGGGITGFLSLWAPSRFIHLLHVHPHWQGCGVGRSLLQALPEWPAQDWRLKCLVQNRRALAFYQAQGFEVVGQGQSPDGRYADLLRKGASTP